MKVTPPLSPCLLRIHICMNICISVIYVYVIYINLHMVSFVYVYEIYLQYICIYIYIYIYICDKYKLYIFHIHEHCLLCSPRRSSVMCVDVFPHVRVYFTCVGFSHIDTSLSTRLDIYAYVLVSFVPFSSSYIHLTPKP